MPTHIAKTAVIDKGAFLGENVTIGNFCHISSGSVIGDETVLSSGVTTIGNVEIGRENHIFSYSVLGAPPQSLNHRDEEGALIIGDRNIIREFATLNSGNLHFSGKTTIGNGNLLMAYVHVAHDCEIGNHNVLANAVTLAGHVEIKDYVTVGGLTPVHQFVKIGSYVMVGGGSAVSQDIPPYCLAQGNRAKLHGLNRHGLRKHLSRDNINIIHRAYKTIFSGENSYKEQATALQKETPSEHVNYFCQFILNSHRGIPLPRKEHVKSKL
jgi:UDP-N-acetylglucosamine acyltransferase